MTPKPKRRPTCSTPPTHTPAPWRHRYHLPKHSTDGYYIIEAGTVQDPTRIACLDGPADGQEALANAQLLAASPRLHAAVKAAMRYAGWLRSINDRKQITWTADAEIARIRATSQTPDQLYLQLQAAHYAAIGKEQS